MRPCSGLPFPAALQLLLLFWVRFHGGRQQHKKSARPDIRRRRSNEIIAGNTSNAAARLKVNTIADCKQNAFSAGTGINAAVKNDAIVAVALSRMVGPAFLRISFVWSLLLLSAYAFVSAKMWLTPSASVKNGTTWFVAALNARPSRAHSPSPAAVDIPINSTPAIPTALWPRIGSFHRISTTIA